MISASSSAFTSNTAALDSSTSFWDRRGAGEECPRGDGSIRNTTDESAPLRSSVFVRRRNCSVFERVRAEAPDAATPTAVATLL